MSSGWKTYEVDGRRLDVLHQKSSDGCGLACVAMVVNRCDGSHPTERAVMHVVNSPGYRGYAHEAKQGRYIPADRDRPAKDRGTDFSYTGTHAVGLADYLRQYGIASKYHLFPSKSDDFGDFIEQYYNPCFPMILKVYVNNRQPHFIVLEGFQKLDRGAGVNFIISDPGIWPAGGAWLAKLNVNRGEQGVIIRERPSLNYFVGEGVECSWQG